VTEQTTDTRNLNDKGNSLDIVKQKRQICSITSTSFHICVYTCTYICIYIYIYIYIPLTWGFHFLGFSYLQSENIQKWKIPGINNLSVLNCVPFWVVQWNLTRSLSILPGTWIISLSSVSTPYILPISWYT
jgi:hypothetical protein